jgi:hypothetical protein
VSPSKGRHSADHVLQGYLVEDKLTSSKQAAPHPQGGSGDPPTTIRDSSTWKKLGTECPICGLSSNPLHRDECYFHGKYSEMDLVKLESEMTEKERDEALEERCLGPKPGEMTRFERCGPCTSDCYAECKGWMPSGDEIRDKMANLKGKRDV